MPRDVPDKPQPARLSRTVLLLFSGPFKRPDGISAFLQQAGLEVEMIDNHPEHGGGEKHNLLLDSVYASLLEKCSSGHYAAIVASPPCSTFSVSRFFAARNAPDGGPPPVRDRENIMGLVDVPPSHRRELDQANLLVERTATLLRTARDAGAEFILEHPADRGHISSPLYLHKRHGPLWAVPIVADLRARHSCTYITIPQCALGAPVQKYTTFMCTP
eukprot:4045758-Pleurochrysis_carterae.AAC.1